MRSVLLPSLVLTALVVALSACQSVAEFAEDVAADITAPEPACMLDWEDVDCDQPHDIETYAIFDSQSPELDVDALGKECYPYFLDYAGVPFGESGLWGQFDYPGTSQWDVGMRQVRCYALFPTTSRGAS